jgi:hypothetical protein
MIRGRETAAAAFAALAVLACLGADANAAVWQHGDRFRGVEATVRRRGEGKRHQRLGRRSLDGDELCQRDHRSRSRPEKFWSIARPVSRQARGLGHRRARSRAEAVPGGAVRIDPATLRRAARAADRDLGNGDGFWQPARQSKHAVLDRHARLRLPSAGIFSPSSSMPLCN